MPRRITGVLVVVAVFVGAAGGCAPAALAAIKARETGLQYTAKTVKVARSVVRRNLIGISADGIFKFKHATGALSGLKRGKVMLLEGSDALLVTAISHSHGKLLVHTKHAGLTDVLSKGTISFSGAPNFRQATLSRLVEPVSTTASAAFARPGYPYVGAAPRPEHASAAAAPAFSAQGSSSTYGYSITFTPTTPTRLDISGTLCYLSFSVCGNGPATGLSAEINFSGYIDTGQASGGITLNGGAVTHTDISMKSLAEHAHITYTVARGDGSSSGGDPPVFHVPIGLDYTIPGEIPIYLKVQVGLLIKLGVSSKNATIHGGLDINTAGSDTITQSGKTVTGSQTGDSITGNILTQGNGGVPPSISLAPSGVVVAVQLPKLGVGLGFTSANGIAYVDVISSIGQTVGSAIAGMLCSSYDVDVTIGAGLEAQVGLGKFGLSLASPRKLLYEKKGQTHDPGCPQT
jgi:hypothetical protein